MSDNQVTLMGVLNITPDSFSDGGLFNSGEAALAHAKDLLKQGAHIVDIGGESTRPGAVLIGAEAEQERIMGTIRELSVQGIPVSVDTINADTAKQAVLNGAKMVNDVSGGKFDPEMLPTMAELVASHGVEIVLGHWRGIPDVNHERSNFDDVVKDVKRELVEQAEKALALGIPREKIFIDPGLGFDKTSEQGWQILARLDELVATGYKVCVGASRKRMIAEVVSSVRGEKVNFKDGDLATAVVSVMAAKAGVHMLRVHDVLATAEALEVERRIREAEANSTHGVELMGKIKLTGLEVYAHHGVFDFEREQGQKFFIDIEIYTDMRPAISGDELAETVHYGELADRVVAAVEADPVDLIETVAERVADIALEFPATIGVEVTVHKPDAPIEHPFADVSVSVTKFKE